MCSESRHMWSRNVSESGWLLQVYLPSRLLSAWGDLWRYSRQKSVFFQLGLQYVCPRCRGAQKENKPFFSTSSFSSITSLLQIALHVLFLMWEGGWASSGSICLYSGADEEIFSRLQHVPYVLSSRKKGQQQQILSKSNISSRLLQQANMWRGGYG